MSEYLGLSWEKKVPTIEIFGSFFIVLFQCLSNAELIGNESHVQAGCVNVQVS